MTIFSTPTWRVGGNHWTACFFVLLCYFNLSLEYFLSSFEALTEIYEFSDPLGYGIKKLDKWFLLPLYRQLELHDLKDIIFR